MVYNPVVEESNHTARSPRLGWRWWLVVLLAGCVLYGVTAQRGVSWQDSGEFQLRVLQGDLIGTMGLARAHPLYILAGRAVVAPFDQAGPWALNVFSGVGLAVALANLAGVVTRITTRRWAGLLTAAMLGLCHSAWWLGTIAEVYTWSLAGLTAELWLLVSLLDRPRLRTLAALAGVNGLGLCMHNFALLALPVYLVVAVWLVARGRLRGRSLGVAALAWLAGAGLLIGMVAAEATQHGLGEAVRSALTGDYAGKVFNLAGASKHARANWMLTAMNLLNPLAPLAVVGLVALWRKHGRALAASVTAITAIEMLFFVRYSVPDQFTFVLPSLAMLAVLAGVGLAALAGRGRRWKLAVAGLCVASLIAQPWAYALAPVAARRWAGPAPQRQPYRDEYRYWLTPWKQDEASAEKFVAVAQKQMPADAILYADSTAVFPLAVAVELDADNQRSILSGQTLYAGPAVACPSDRPIFATRSSALPGELAESGLLVPDTTGPLLIWQP